MRPMLATPGDPTTGPPQGPGWAHEIKWDGIRVLLEARDGRLRALTRSGRDIAVALPELAAVADVADDLVLDGEAVALVDGRPSFSHVVDRVHTTSANVAERLSRTRPVTYLAFDLLRLDGLDLTPLPWSARREALEGLLDGVPGVQVSPAYPDGAGLLAATAAQGLEGVVSKRRSSPYREGERSGDWLKFPHRDVRSVVIGGWRPQTGTVGRLGALHVGVPARDATGRLLRDDDGWPRLLYRGRVGSGLAGRAGATLLDLLGQVEVGRSPFTSDLPRAEVVGTTWLRPQVVVDVAALGVTGDGRLRQPSYQGVRTDLDLDDLPEEP